MKGLGRKLAITAAGFALALAALTGFGLYVSPWPGAMLIRWIFDRGAEKASAGLEAHLPADVVSTIGIRYDRADPLALLDIHRPKAAAGPLPVIVWVHGGGFVSGNRGYVANYLRIWAGRGFATVGVDYSIAPEAIYPRPVHQVNAALAWVRRHGHDHGLDPDRIILAGDSAGAQIAAQMANIVTAPDYARVVGVVPAIQPAALRGALLFCGAYDASMADAGGPVGLFVTNVLWSYSGRRDYRAVPGFALMSAPQHVTPAFPPSFITAGNADPLEPQSRLMAKALERQGVKTETLFYPADHRPRLLHEYQYKLDLRDGRIATERAIAFAQRLMVRPKAAAN